MDRNSWMLPMVPPKLVPDYRGAAGEQAFYDAMTRNLEWFEREMAACRNRLEASRTAALAGRTATISQ